MERLVLYIVLTVDCPGAGDVLSKDIGKIGLHG